MSRWPVDARERLERAAIELFVEKGFAATTVPEITARAGLTTRTFHRHFADKREVLYAGNEIPEFTTRLIAEAPASWTPMRVVVDGLLAVAAARFEGRREDLRVRREIVRSDPGLGERDLRKWADVGSAGTAAFIARGVEPMRAALLAETAVTLLRVSVGEWLDSDDDRGLGEILRGAWEALRDATSLDGP
ncbi:helix-turn-helix domain-containing protein [Actinoplanes sp. NPDC026619]|uniref:TetR/AcrR family transcriptional regulator n=1 Tax=Actinoplanes sp. NPDC026619 TaxID=3155798 RepID=UPI003404997C